MARSKKKPELLPKFNPGRYIRSLKLEHPEFSIVSSHERGEANAEIDFSNGISVAIGLYTAIVAYPIDGKYEELPICRDEIDLTHAIIKAHKLFA